LLADELNRTPPKTQAALLEAMQEHTVSFAGVTHALPEPFFVLATQNPIEQAGTYPLPEAQLDRFLLHIALDYPGEEDERAIIAQTTGAAPAQVPRVMGGEDVLALQALVRQVHVGEDLLAWITRRVRATRPGEGAPQLVREYGKWGAGPRAARAAGGHARGRAGARRAGTAAPSAAVVRRRGRGQASGRAGRGAAGRTAVPGRLSAAGTMVQDPVGPALRAQLRGLRIASRRASPLRGGGLHRGRDRGAGLEFSQYRGYEPGDEPRRIDWKLYARSDRFFV